MIRQIPTAKGSGRIGPQLHPAPARMIGGL